MRDLVICPDCKTENIAGVDFCECCWQELRSLDLPRAHDAFTAHLLNDRLGELGVEQPQIVGPGDPVGLAVHVMQQHQAGCVLVSDGGELVGILTERDILLKAADDKVDLNAVAVRELMTADPVILREDDVLAVALHKMSIGGFRHIPFVAGGRAARVVSIQDVFRYISAFIDEPAPASL